MRPAKLAAPVFVGALSAAWALCAYAKLPPPSDEAKAKAAEAAAKTAWTDKVASFQLCKAMNKAAANYQATAKQLGKTAATPLETPPCTDPGPYVPPAAASAPPIEAAGAHSPPKTATAPPSTTTPAAAAASKSK